MDPERHAAESEAGDEEQEWQDTPSEEPGLPHSHIV